MKRLIYISLAAIVVVILSLFAAYHYRDTRRQANQEAVQTLRDAENVLRTAREANAQLRAEYNVLFAECEKGAAAYEKLPTATKDTIEQPNCGTALLE